MTPQALVDGWCDPAFTAVGDAFRENFADASRRARPGREVASTLVDLWGAGPAGDGRSGCGQVPAYLCSKVARAGRVAPVEERLDLDGPSAATGPSFDPAEAEG